MRFPKLNLPTSHVNDEPRFCLEVNEQWREVLLSVIAMLEMPASWKPGMDVDRAEQEIIALTLMVLNAQRCAAASGLHTSIVGEQMGMFRQNGCKLEYSIDGECWCVVFDAAICIQGTAGQQPPGGELEEGECRTYEVVIPATGFILPVPVAGNYQITIQNAQGGWADGSGLWFCPEGRLYALGICGGVASPSGSDPLPTANHMRLLAKVGTTYYDAFNSQFTVSADQSLADLEFLPNDPSPEDGKGSISATIVVCNAGGGTGNWEHETNFLSVNGGWTPLNTNWAAWTSGSGWGNGAGSSGEVAYIEHTLSHSGTLTHFDAVFTSEAATIGYQAAVIVLIRGATSIELQRDNSLADTPGGTLSWNGTQAYSSGDKLRILVNVNVAEPNQIWITSTNAMGSGADPL